MRRFAIALGALAAASPAAAHGDHHRPVGWTLDPWVTVPLAVTLLSSNQQLTAAVLPVTRQATVWSN